MTRSSTIDGPITFCYSGDEPGQPIIAIVRAVAWLKNVDESDLEPLYSSVDIEALTGGEPTSPRTTDRNTRPSEPIRRTVTFRYEGCLVTVTADRLTVEPD